MGKAKEICINDDDRKHLIKLRKEYKNILRNLWDPFDRNREAVIGCNTINRLYITPIGDVLPCPYVHTKVGNVYNLRLKKFQRKDLKLDI